MKRAEIALLFGILASYLLPWHVCVTEWYAPGHGDPSPRRWRCLSGARLSWELAGVAVGQAYRDTRLWLQGRRHTHSDRALVNALFCVTHTAPIAVAAWALARNLRKRPLKPRQRLWSVVVLVSLAGLHSYLAWTHKGYGGPVLYRIWDYPPHRPVVWGPSACLIFSVALACVWVTLSRRERSRAARREKERLA